MSELSRRLRQLYGLLTENETYLGVSVYGPETCAYWGAPPQTAWEATQQGYAEEEEARRRLDRGPATIRDISKILATLRVRTWRLASPSSTSGLLLHTQETGPSVTVNGTTSLEEGRFWFAPGLRKLRYLSSDESNRLTDTKSE